MTLFPMHVERSDQRCVAALHSLHADEERMREHAAGEQSRCEAADAWIAPRKMCDVGGSSRGIQKKRQQVHGITGRTGRNIRAAYAR